MHRQLPTVLFASFYLTISTGLAVHMHLCQGHVVSLQLSDHEKPGCCTSSATTSCHAATPDDCCDDLVEVIQFDEWQVTSSAPQWLSIGPTGMKSSMIWPELSVSYTEDCGQIGYIEPPPPTDRPLWLLYRNIRYHTQDKDHV